MKFDRNIDIGSLEAEDDEFLINSFVTKSDYQALQDTSNQKCIILGRTGMGKSALIRKLIESKENVSRIRPEEMSLRFLSNSDILNYFRRLGISLDLFYKVLWKHVFIVEILKLYYGEDKIKTGNKFQSLYESVDFRLNKQKKNAVEYLRRWHDKFWENTEYRIREIEDKLRESLRVSLGSEAKLYEDFVKAQIGAEAEEIIEKSRKTDVLHKAQSVVNDIQLTEISTILKIIHNDLLPKTKRKFYIVIDDLDKHWVDKKIVYDLIVALILCIKDINNCPNFKIVISIRLNLLQLALQHANTTGFQREKFDNMLLHLYWNEGELKTLLQNRVNTLFRRSNEPIIELPEILPKDPGRGGKTDGFTHMLERSFYRPRDIISFFNKSIKYANGASKISREAINLAENDYSLERLNAIEDEWNENYKFLEPYFDVLRGKPSKFIDQQITYKDIRKFCYAMSKTTKDKEFRQQLIYGWKNRGKLARNKKHILNILYKIGCVGVKRSAESALVYSFHYTNTLETFDLQSEYKYYVNPALTKALEIRTEKNNNPSQNPKPD